MMNVELKNDWIAKLRSGNYKQGKGDLYNPNTGSYCCLGVLGYECMGVEDKSSLEPYDLVETVMTREQKWHFVDMNDGNCGYRGNKQSFEQIADYIEANL